MLMDLRMPLGVVWGAGKSGERACPIEKKLFEETNNKNYFHSSLTLSCP